MARRPEPPKLNALERAIAFISPAWAAKREAARGMMAMAGGYSGAAMGDRLGAWTPGTNDADGDISWGLSDLRGRSADLVRNSAIAAGAIETQVSHIVGTGLSMQSRINAKALGMTPEQAAEWQNNTEARFEVWAGSELADAHGRLTFYDQQDVAFRSSLERGDSFVILAAKSRPNWPFSLALQVIEADLVSNPNGEQDREDLIHGIERSGDGEPVAAHIASRHPGSVLPNSTATTWERREFRGAKSGRRNVLHLMRTLRPGQTRGVPCLAPIIDTLKQLTRYTLAEVDAAVNSACLALFAKMDPETFQDVFDADSQKQYLKTAGAWDGTIKPNSVINMLPGESIENPIQNRPNPNFDPFFQALLKQIGIGLNVPFEVLLKHFSSSYSAARAALLDAWRHFRIRRAWLAARLCQPVYEEWLADEVAAGRISAPGFFSDPMVRAAWCGAQWIGDGPGAINPKDEAEAAQTRVDMGLTTLPEEIVAYDGGSWEAKHATQVRVQKAREKDGLAAPANAPKPGAAAPSQPGAPQKPPANQQ